MNVTVAKTFNEILGLFPARVISKTDPNRFDYIEEIVVDFSGFGDIITSDSDSLTKKFNPNQPRNEKGQWTSGGLQLNHPAGSFGSEDKRDYEGAAKTCAELTGTSKEQAMKMAKAVNDFTGTGYKDIRRYQTKGTPDKKEESDTIEDFIARSPKWSSQDPLYRGIVVEKSELNAFLKRVDAGKVTDMLGTSSWTTRKTVAESFSKTKDGVGVVFQTSGTQKGTSVRYLSKYPKQSEVLCSKDAKWRVKRVIPPKGQRTYYIVECIPKNYKRK